MKKHPSHIALVARGSIAWARARGLDPRIGLRAGAQATEAAIIAASELGVHQLTLIGLDGFDGRAAHPAAAAVLDAELQAAAPLLRRLGVRLRCAGDLGTVPRALHTAMQAAASATEGHSGMQVTLLCGYRGRADLVRVARLLLGEVAAGVRPLDAIDEEAIEAELATAPLPRPDLIVRTGPLRQLTDALTFEGAYAELFFTGAPWPAFSGTDLSRALADYGQRERRFGKTSEQVQSPTGPWTAAAGGPL
ncbi:MAG: undecaprenyl diphosphate synthase family protein [Polyangia bacterium]